VLVHAEVKEYGMVVDQGCMKCMDCVSVCPNDALYFGFGKPAAVVSKSIKKNYSLTWPEEIGAAIVFFVSFMAVWDVYQLVPMLMALGIATVTTFVAMRTWRMFRAADLSFYRHNLKSSGKIQKAGWVFLGFAVIWVGLNLHSGWIRYNESTGSRAFEAIRIPDELALAETNPKQWLSAEDQKQIVVGKTHLEKAVDHGLVVNTEALPKLAWVEYLAGNTERSINLLGVAASNQQGQGKALSLYYRGAILNRLGRYNEALSSLDQALAERDDLVLAREEKGEALWQLGSKKEAVTVWKDAVWRNPRLVLANNMLAGASALEGKTGEEIAYEKQADQFTPGDPYFHWMIGLRLRNVGMNKLAEKHFSIAIKLNPSFRSRRNF
jgi:tetratricopeptide (TPR) repeat protein